MNLRIEIGGEQAICRQDGAEAYSAPLPDFLAAVAERSDYQALPDAIPEGVRFIRRRGDVVVLVMESHPAVRTVRWLADNSPVPFGKGSVYRTASLAFPFIIAIMTFRGGRQTSFQQCFYRTEPLEKLTDPLFLPNLYNVAEAYRMKCWLCLANLKTDLKPLSWSEKVKLIQSHLWGAAWNQSSEMHEGNSYWGTMRDLDPRLKSLDAWERATRENPLFPLMVQWRPAGKTAGEIIEEMLVMALPPPVPVTVEQLAHVLRLSNSPNARQASSK